MRRYARDNRPHVRPVEKIQLSEDNTVRRAVAAALLLIIGAAALAYSFSRLFALDAGWQTIEAGPSGGPTCADDFTLLYELGAGDQDPRSENRKLVQAYTQACRTAYQLFHTMESFEGVTNLCDINAQPNRTLTVDPVLYGAFEAVLGTGDRTVYLGPVWARYSDLFACQEDSQTVDFDPWTSEAVAEEYAAIAAYAADPAHIKVELLGENQICLRVSEEYLAYAAQEGIHCFLDFGWMRNAFIVDYLADTLAGAGLTHGVLSSYDGFARCLDEREGGFTLDLYGWEKGRPIIAGTVEYRGPMSVVNICSFPVTEGDWQRFYQLRDGSLRTPYLDVSDGRSRTAADADCLVCYSPALSCAELAMGAASACIGDSLREEAVEKLIWEGSQVIWCRERTFYASDPDLIVDNLYEGYAAERLSLLKRE